MYEFIFRQLGNEPSVVIKGDSIDHVLRSRFFKLWTFASKSEIFVRDGKVFYKLISDDKDGIVIGRIRLCESYYNKQTLLEHMVNEVEKSLFEKAINRTPFKRCRLEYDDDNKCRCVSRIDGGTWFSIPSLDGDPREIRRPSVIIELK